MLSSSIHAALAKGYILAGLISCSPQTPAEVTLRFINNPATIDNSKDESQLQATRKGSISPSYGNEFPVVQGLHTGTYQLSHTIDFEDTYRPMIGACIHATRMQITLTYTPVIYIKSNHAPGSCHYETTLGHERKHVATDVATLTEYIPEIKKMATLALAAAANNKPVDKDQMSAEHSRIEAAVSQTLEKSSDAMQAVRTYRQQAVDSREEYERLSGLCLNEPR